MPFRSTLLLIAVLVWAMPVRAAEPLIVSVEKVDGIYYVMTEVWLDAPQESVYDTFSDWDIAVEFSSFVVESRDVEPGEDGRPGFYVRNRACILFFCKSVTRAGAVDAEPYHTIRAISDPEISDFHQSDEAWLFRSEDDGTIVRYELEARPKFWIPPLIGTWMMKRKFERDSADAMERIEAIAQQRAAASD